MIKKIKLFNYKNFKESEIYFNKRNIFVGENGVGKTSILKAISYVLSGSPTPIEKKGFQSLFNVEVIEDFLNSKKHIKQLPSLTIEIYFDYTINTTYPKSYEINGMHNTDKKDCPGLQMKISPSTDELDVKEIEMLLKQTDTFPFEYYKLQFSTFSGQFYNNYIKRHNITFDYIDSSLMNSNFAVNKYISNLYQNQTTVENRHKISLNFRELSNEFSNKLYSEYNLIDNSEYKLHIKSPSDFNFSDQITAKKKSIDITDFGKGEKIMLGMETSLEIKKNDMHIVLIEEPENHLSFINMLKLINLIEKNNSIQTFVATHNNMVASRLDLINVIWLSDHHIFKLNQLEKSTSKFFQKAPDTNILDFVLSTKSILVEGDAEYILMEYFYKKIANSLPFEQNVTIIACGGKTFKRYLQVARLLKKQVAVITDNDGDYNKNIEKLYSEYSEDEFIKIFADKCNKNNTFEVCLYNENKRTYEKEIKTSKMTNGILKYMLDNKTESAFNLLIQLEQQKEFENFVIPKYIQDAIKWIS